MIKLRENVMPVLRTAFKLNILLTFVILLSVSAFAQENWGSLNGIVTDSSGAVVPGATIKLESPTVPKPLETTSNEQGRYTFPQVPIGTYTLTASKTGFTKLVQRLVEVKLGSQITYNAKLAVGQVSEVVEVVESVAAIDLTSARTQTNITATTFDNLPKGRNFHSLLSMAPGVRMEMKNGNAGVGGFQVDGASGSENSFVVDGVDVSDIRRGSLRLQNSIPFEFVQEIQIKSSGFEAEFGGATGGVVTVATKGGSNDFHGAAQFQATTDGMVPRPRGSWKRSPANANLADFFAPPKDSFKDLYPGFSFTGPIVKNLAYFSLGYYPTMATTDRTIPYASGTRTFHREDTFNYGLGRLDISPTSKLQANTSFIWTPYKRQGAMPQADPRIAAPSNDQSILGGYQPAKTATTSVTYTASPNLIFTGRYGYKYQNDKDGNYGLPTGAYLSWSTSSVGLAGVPAEFQKPNGSVNISSNLQTLYDVTTRHNLYLDGSWIANAAGQHMFKFGYAMNRLSNNVNISYPGGRFIFYFNDTFNRGSIQNQRGQYGYYTWEDGVNNQGSVNSKNHGFYIQDSWKASSRLTLNLGVRLENEFLPPYKAEVNGKKVANPVKFGWGDKIAPRLGFAWDVTGKGKTKIAGSFGLFYDLMKYEIARGSFGSDYWVSHVYKLETPANLGQLSKTNPGAGGTKITQYDNRTLPINAAGEIEGVDPDLKPYTSREFSGSLTHEINSRLVFTARYVHKNLLRAIEDIGVLDADGNEVYLTGNPGFGDTRNTKTDYGQKTPNGQEFLVPKAVRNYDGMEFRLDGRYSKFLGMASYTWSRLYGNYSGTANSDESGRSDPGVSRAYDLPYYYFDASGSQKNQLGRLGTDRPHTFKFFGSYDVPWKKGGKTTFGLNQIAYSGTPDSTSVIYLSAPTFPYGRGDMGRTPVLTQTDLTVSHLIRATERVSVKLEANIINLFNQASVTTRVTQLNRASAITIDPSDFFKGYDPRKYVTVGGSVPYNPIYGLAGGNYASGNATLDAFGRYYGTTGYQDARNIRLGIRLMF